MAILELSFRRLWYVSPTPFFDVVATTWLENKLPYNKIKVVVAHLPAKRKLGETCTLSEAQFVHNLIDL